MKFTKLKVIFFLLIFSLILGNSSLAKDPSAEVSIAASATEVAAGGELQISVNIKNISINGFDLGNIAVPGLESFQERGTNQSTQVQIVNGVSMAVTDMIKTVVAPRAGKYKIGPISLGVKDDKGQIKIFSSNSIEINVTDAGPKSDDSINVAGNSSGEKSNSKSFDYWALMKNLIALGGLVLLVYLLRKKSTSQESISTEIEDEVINEKKTLPDESDADFYPKSKSYILDHIRNKFKIEVESKTSQEVLAALKAQNVYLYEDYKKALEICDFGKFSGGESSKEELRGLLRKII